MAMSPSTQDVETLVLLANLGAQRDHVMGTLDRLGEDELRQPVLPSGWTILGLVRHLTLDVELFWFSAVVAGDQQAIGGLAKGAEAWQVRAGTSSSEVLGDYQREIDRANRIVASTLLTAEPLWWPTEHFGESRPQSVREIIPHVIVETACHAGQLDVVRELLDGRQWLVLT
jgi:uncharacterized damage-inducible protein DinB